MLTRALTLLSLISVSTAGAAMSMLDIGQAWFFSPVSAVVEKDGIPLVGVKVIRRWEHESLSEDETVTDDKGQFSFPEIRGRTIVQVMPAEFVVAQQIVVVVEDEEVEIWSNSKRKTDLNSELGGAPLDLHCEITDEDKMYRDFGAAMFTKCTWRS